MTLVASGCTGLGEVGLPIWIPPGDGGVMLAPASGATVGPALSPGGVPPGVGPAVPGGAADAGTPPANGGPGGAPLRPADAGSGPFAAAPVCTSRTMYSGGEGPRMRPGEACISCHRRDDGPSFVVAGTVYPTAHEPSRCNGADGNGNARGTVVVVTDAAGRSVSAGVNAAGNFSVSDRGLRPPFRAKVVFDGRERLMIGTVPVGDCNICHTQAGTTIVPGGPRAPGRILLP
jgi:hypothetical protein